MHVALFLCVLVQSRWRTHAGTDDETHTQNTELTPCSSHLRCPHLHFKQTWKMSTSMEHIRSRWKRHSYTAHAHSLRDTHNHLRTNAQKCKKCRKNRLTFPWNENDSMFFLRWIPRSFSSYSLCRAVRKEYREESTDAQNCNFRTKNMWNVLSSLEAEKRTKK